ncbi:BPTI/Kunitz domain-containing protein-like [Crotalus tigris]|uniref:BPTI/Kunitz domain-containing protein-like n=1 Tax=Crotalus tigris TaxID=88082 RepID=UPI00192F6E1B|nr:BPTI/Kunitz domain-containing protein-like [Crotalus tigris]
MRSGGSLLFLFWGAFLIWSPLLSVSRLFYGSCKTIPNLMERCGKLEERFFYNATSKMCEPFVYYGCLKNRNRFYTLETCQQFCGLVDYCQLPPDPGFCKYQLQRWFYNPETRQCKTFIYQGCGGNYNNFKKRLTCQRKCPKKGSP